MVVTPLFETFKYARGPFSLCGLAHFAGRTWKRRAGGRMSRPGGVRCDCTGPESVGAGRRGGAVRRWDGPDSPCYPLSCTDPDSSSGTSPSRSRWTGQWLTHWRTQFDTG